MTMFFQYRIDDEITLELQSPFHARELFDLVNENQTFIGEHLAWAKKIQTVADIKLYMQRDLSGMVDERRWAWLIRYKGRAAGRIGLFVTMPALQECELYYFLGKQFTGKGLITRAAKVVVDFAINILRLKHVLIGFNPENAKSGAVAERLGFQYEYTMRDAAVYEQEWRSLHFWGIVSKDWHSTTTSTFTFELNDNLNLQLYQPYQSDSQFKVLKENQEELGQWFWWSNDRFSLAKEKGNARKRLQSYANKSGLAISIWHENSLIGNLWLSVNKKNKSGNIGYWLDKSVRGHGIMTRTVRALLNEAFTKYKLQRIGILTASTNLASRALAERLGMQLELFQKDETIIRGQFIDHVQYSILREEWKEAQI